MKAVVKVKNGMGNVEVLDVQIPEISPDQVLLKVKGAGICGSDLHIFKDDGGYKANPNVTLGHEVSGIVAKVGENVKGWKAGDAVVSETYYSTCGNCWYCKTGNINLCEQKLSIGSAVNGAMAEYVKVPAVNLHPLPKGMSFEEGAMVEPLVCCVQAVFQFGKLTPGEKVVLSGPGAIGLLTLQVIKLFGCDVVVLGTKKDEERLQMALRLGADKILYVEEPDIIDQVKAFCNGVGADVAFDCSGAGPAINLCMDVMRKGARYVQVGIPGKPVALDMGKIVLREYKIFGTYATRPVWWDKTIELLNQGKIQLKPLVSSAYPLEDWEKGFTEALNGEGFKHVLID